MQFSRAIVLATYLAALAWAAAAAHAGEKPAPAPTTRPLVLVELFTSEGCSSCPPADRLLAELASGDLLHDAQIVPLALHVNYWNHGGWADPFSSEKFTHRQEDYARAFHLDQMYTPQMIVDGSAQLVGSDREGAIKAIAHAAAAAGAKAKLAIEPTLSPDAKRLSCKVALLDLPPDLHGPADLRLAVTEDDLARDVLRGENAGRTLRHTAVVRSLLLIAQLDLPRDRAYTGGTTNLDLPAEWDVRRLKVVAFLQDHQTHRILAVASTPVQSDK